jgi:hypothetical protein
MLPLIRGSCILNLYVTTKDTLLKLRVLKDLFGVGITKHPLILIRFYLVNNGIDYQYLYRTVTI